MMLKRSVKLPPVIMPSITSASAKKRAQAQKSPPKNKYILAFST